MLNLTIDDEGPGIPEYASEKVFERFFSLQRPETGKKSTGLGLNLAREAAHTSTEARSVFKTAPKRVSGPRCISRYDPCDRSQGIGELGNPASF